MRDSKPFEQVHADVFRRIQAISEDNNRAMQMHRLIGTEGQHRVDTLLPGCGGTCEQGERPCDCPRGLADEAALYDEPKPSLWQRLKAKLAEWNRNHWIGDEQ